ncbi:hypothetical protein [Salinisphaera sp. LB1]|uniref:hypothetical protein n=1 Tax=Salinisphaera sp. LB1 TaxID=2183911 RepID=UPI000D706C4E|nr:hypothetical protein [Salinisphaera sp. LB1]
MNAEAHIEFTCPCGAQVVLVSPVPPPNLMAERHSDSTQEQWDSAFCDACTKDFDVCVRNTYFDVDVEIEGAVQVTFDVAQYPDDNEISEIIASTDQCDDFELEMRQIVLLAELSAPDSAHRTLFNLLHVQAVTLIETYLSSVLIHEVMNSDANLRRLVETDPELSKMKFSLADIFTQYDKLRFTVAKHLSAIIYHNIAKVNNLYANVLGIEFGDHKWLYQAVSKRHDCVHRNGYTTQKDKINTSKEEVLELAKLAGAFIANIDQQVSYARYERT